MEPRLGRRSRAPHRHAPSFASRAAASRASRSSSAIPIARRGLVWNQQLQVTLGLPDGLRTLPVRIADGRVDVPDAHGLPAPRFVLPSGGGIGYGGFELDAASVAYLATRLPEIDDPLTRGAAWITLWEQMLDGRTPASRRRQPGAPRVAARDRRAEHPADPELRAPGLLELPRRPTRAAQIAPRLEQVLRDGLAAAPTSSLKSAWFSALRDIAQTESTLAWLERVWRKTESVPGLTLAEPDYITLALELAVRERAAWQAILDEQFARIENPDRKERFAYVRPALSADQGVRDTFFERLNEIAFRRREAWVLEGLSYLHHPLRAASSEKYISPQPRPGARDSADGRHLLPEAMDGCDAWWAQLRDVGADGRALPRGAAAGLSRSPPARHPVVVGQRLPGERRATGDVIRVIRVPSSDPRDPRVGSGVRVIRVPRHVIRDPRPLIA